MNQHLLSHLLTHLTSAERHEVIRSYMAALSIGQRGVAERAEVDYQRLRKILSGHYPDRGDLDKVERVLLEDARG